MPRSLLNRASPTPARLAVPPICAMSYSRRYSGSSGRARPHVMPKGAAQLPPVRRRGHRSPRARRTAPCRPRTARVVDRPSTASPRPEAEQLERFRGSSTQMARSRGRHQGAASSPATAISRLFACAGPAAQELVLRDLPEHRANCAGSTPSLSRSAVDAVAAPLSAAARGVHHQRVRSLEERALRAASSARLPASARPLASRIEGTNGRRARSPICVRGGARLASSNKLDGRVDARRDARARADALPRSMRARPSSARVIVRRGFRGGRIDEKQRDDEIGGARRRPARNKETAGVLLVASGKAVLRVVVEPTPPPPSVAGRASCRRRRSFSRSRDPRRRNRALAGGAREYDGAYVDGTFGSGFDVVLAWVDTALDARRSSHAPARAPEPAGFGVGAGRWAGVAPSSLAGLGVRRLARARWRSASSIDPEARFECCRCSSRTRAHADLEGGAVRVATPGVGHFRHGHRWEMRPGRPRAGGARPHRGELCVYGVARPTCGRRARAHARRAGGAGDGDFLAHGEVASVAGRAQMRGRFYELLARERFSASRASSRDLHADRRPTSSSSGRVTRGEGLRRFHASPRANVRPRPRLVTFDARVRLLDHVADVELDQRCGAPSCPSGWPFSRPALSGAVQGCGSEAGWRARVFVTRQSMDAFSCRSGTDHVRESGSASAPQKASRLAYTPLKPVEVCVLQNASAMTTTRSTTAPPDRRRRDRVCASPICSVRGLRPPRWRACRRASVPPRTTTTTWPTAPAAPPAWAVGAAPSHSTPRSNSAAALDAPRAAAHVQTQLKTIDEKRSEFTESYSVDRRRPRGARRRAFASRRHDGAARR